MASIRHVSSMPSDFEVSDKFIGPHDTPCGVQLAVVHPLKESEVHHDEQKLKLDFALLRQNFGLAAPLKFAMEINAVKKTTGHLPFLPSRNPSLQVLTGRDEVIEFEDFIGTTRFEETYQQPHAVMEKMFKIL